MTLSNEVFTYIQQAQEEACALLKELCQIPAPSGQEERRAAFVYEWLKKQGAENVWIDPALNVVCPIGCDKAEEIVVFMAHTDVVFPDLTPLPCREEEGKLFAPGAGDDTAQLVLLLLVVKYLLREKLSPRCGVLFVANSGEEGLGNLKGCRQIFKDYGARMKRFYTFDAVYDMVVNRCVGSHRYRVRIATEGGHSYDKFGNRNAIAYMAMLISRLYALEVPCVAGSKTTYNVGTISGGTSVNTIAEDAEILCEYRSDDECCLREMEQKFQAVFDSIRAEGVEITVERIGERPCMKGVDPVELWKMTEESAAICQKYTGLPCRIVSGSTDANIPMSNGVPGICVGAINSGGAHTRGEWVELKSLETGMKIAAELILQYFCEEELQ